MAMFAQTVSFTPIHRVIPAAFVDSRYTGANIVSNEGASEYLKKMVNYLPILTARLDDDGESGVIVSVILEQMPAEVAVEA